MSNLLIVVGYNYALIWSIKRIYMMCLEKESSTESASTKPYDFNAHVKDDSLIVCNRGKPCFYENRSWARYVAAGFQD